MHPCNLIQVLSDASHLLFIKALLLVEIQIAILHRHVIVSDWCLLLRLDWLGRQAALPNEETRRLIWSGAKIFRLLVNAYTLRGNIITLLGSHALTLLWRLDFAHLDHIPPLGCPLSRVLATIRLHLVYQRRRTDQLLVTLLVG